MRAIAVSQDKSVVVEYIKVVFFTLLMAVAANIRVPLFFTPVPLTFQTLVVFLSVIFCGRRALFSQALYIALGAAGFGVFANGGAGLLYLCGPTAGYLAGFALAAYLLPCFIGRGKAFRSNLVLFMLAGLLIDLSGAAWLAAGCGFSASQAFTCGVLPFLAGDAVKAMLAALALRATTRMSAASYGS